MDLWIYGFMDLWIYGFMDLWIYGFMDFVIIVIFVAPPAQLSAPLNPRGVMLVTCESQSLPADLNNFCV
jgi:hypothetical protein